MPNKNYPTIVFDQSLERLPNPVAFFMNDQLWPDDASYKIKIPWIQSHGDLNPQNVLCPSYTRAAGQNLVNTVYVQMRLLDHISLIDMPFCRNAPFTFDMAFLASWLNFRLLSFDSHTRRDIALTTYQAILEEIVRPARSLPIPAEGQNYATCLSEIWKQLASESKMIPDIERGYLAALSSSSLWLATKNIEKNRLRALSSLRFSALALKTLLGDAARYLASPDFHIEMDTSTNLEWTDAAKSIGQRLEQLREQRSLLLVLGTKWSDYLGLLSEEKKLLNLESDAHTTEDIRRLRDIRPLSAIAEKLSAIGKLPLVAVIDWSVFPCLREAIGQSLASPNYFTPFLSGQKEPDWYDRKCIMYCHWRGSLEDVNSLACRAPVRAKSRANLRRVIEHFSMERSQDLTALYIGVSTNELRELHEFLQEVWRGRLSAIYVGTVELGMVEYFQEWEIGVIPGTIQDFINACADFATTVTMGLPTGTRRRLLQIAGMGRDEEGGLYVSPEQVLPVNVGKDDYIAISRAGYLLLEEDRKPSIESARDPRNFFIGYRIEFSEIQREILVERDNFKAYFKVVRDKLSTRQPQPLMVIIPSRPGAGASTTLKWLAYQTAMELHIPTLVLERGGNVAFEAIERLYSLVGRSFLVVADPEDVPIDELRGIETRCMPSGYPILFLTSSRVFQERREYDTDLPLLDIRLSDREKRDLLNRPHQYCIWVSLIKIKNSSVMSLFLLLLEAFEGDNIRIETFVSSLLKEIPQRQRSLSRLQKICSYLS